jgi:hypothetical protein
MGDERDLNEALARAARDHQVVCREDDHGFWHVACEVCVEDDPDHANFGRQKVWPAPYGEQMASRIAWDHLSKLGYVPNRLMTTRQGRPRYE